MLLNGTGNGGSTATSLHAKLCIVLDALMILQNLLKACRYDRERSDWATRGGEVSRAKKKGYFPF